MVDGLATYTEMDEKYIPVGSITIAVAVPRKVQVFARTTVGIPGDREMARKRTTQISISSTGLLPPLVRDRIVGY